MTKGHRSSWLDHPRLEPLHEVRTRLGIAPNHHSFRVGVLRTHLLTAVVAEALARHRQHRTSIFVRLDDTNASRTESVETAGLLNELLDVAQIPVDPLPKAIRVSESTNFVRQSDRVDRYLQMLWKLDNLGLVRDNAGIPTLSVVALDDTLRARGIRPSELVSAALTNVPRVPVECSQTLIPLLRADGTPLWHLATVTDDIDMHVNLVVRAIDKMSAVSIQERLRYILSDGQQSVAYIFVPRLVETDTDASRVATILSGGIRKASLRRYMFEPFSAGNVTHVAHEFGEMVSTVRRDCIPLHDAAFDMERLSAIERKMAAELSTDELIGDLVGIVGQDHMPIVELIASEWPRSLGDQLRLYRGMTEVDVDFSPPPADARLALSWMESAASSRCDDEAPYGVRWVLTGRSDGPRPAALLHLIPRELQERRRAAASALLS